jgi:hypothetical protein
LEILEPGPQLQSRAQSVAADAEDAERAKAANALRIQCGRGRPQRELMALHMGLKRKKDRRRWFSCSQLTFGGQDRVSRLAAPCRIATSTHFIGNLQ